MKKVVLFTNIAKLPDALAYFNSHRFANKTIPIKLHMGERKNQYYTKPAFVKHIVDELKKLPAEPYLFDTTVAYSGLRHTKEGYQQLADLHGFTSNALGCPIVIDDTGTPITIEDKEYEVADHLIAATHIFAISHVKGHVATGMGGAIKNFGMGGVTKETKKTMHRGSRPQYQKDACTFCGQCAEVCPFDAIQVNDENLNLNDASCFGCGVCVDACATNALVYTDADFQYVLACAAMACVQDKNVIYLNDVNRIARSCDCDPSAGPIICPDIGYLVSTDPVAIDKASLDLIHDIKKDIFEKENHVNPLKQITYGEEIGLGTSSYELIEV